MFRKRKVVTPLRLDATSAKNLPAKAYEDESGCIHLGRDIETHCKIVGAVAHELIQRMPQKLQEDLFPMGSELVAAVHDVGKCSPTFVRKLVNVAISSINVESLSFIIPEDDPSLEKTWGGHSGVSQIALKHLNVGKYIPEIAGQHHGFTPPVDAYLANDAVFGGPTWQEQRSLLVESLKLHFGVEFPALEGDAQARAIAGLTCVADWIGSGKHFENPNDDWLPLVSTSVSDAGFTRPIIRRGLTFKDIFGFAEPRPAQNLLIKNGYKSGVHIMEAPMGIGKTEAALYCAYLAMSEYDATGIYFALPTQVTSNAIYRRFNAFLSNVIDGSPEAYLLHGAAWLVDKVEMGAAARPGGSWFDSKKRGLLAPFAVGTVDQALMAAMNVKHGFVRAFGLAGKVVILDEVHTYDAYTGTILDSLISLLSSLNCTVIILSATLSTSRRNLLLNRTTSSTEYPLVCSAMLDMPVEVEGLEMRDTHHITTSLVSTDSDSFTEALNRATLGEQVLWVENTVGEAQVAYKELVYLASGKDIELGLIHSKFTQQDRTEREEYWVAQYGKAGYQTRGNKGRILVGTQVLEQSLDIDADFLVTRFCPTDMLLQRMGRLWRHSSTPRVTTARCEAWILVPSKQDVDTKPGEAFGNSGFVYSPYVLSRTFNVWAEIKSVVLPSAIRGLIERTYCAQQEVGTMAKLYDDLMHGTRHRKGVDTLKNFAAITLAKNGQTLPESKAQTRYSEDLDVPLLLISGLTEKKSDGYTEIRLLDGSTLKIPIFRKSIAPHELRAISATLARQMISVLPKRAPVPMTVGRLRGLGFSNCMYIGKEANQPSDIRIGFVADSGVIKNPEGTHELFYDNLLGFRAIRV